MSATDSPKTRPEIKGSSILFTSSLRVFPIAFNQMVAWNFVEKAVREVLDEVTTLRRTLHRYPELSHSEYRTTALLADALADHGIDVRVRQPSRTGLVAEIGSGGPVAAWRCDLDGLPIQEPAGNLHSSKNPGVMHACGHDAHAAIGFGVAAALNRIPDLGGRVRIVFQHSEESGPSGAAEMLEEGVMEDVVAIAALHVDTSLQVGKVGLKKGPITSSADLIRIVLTGPGGHTARPHLTTDLLYAAGRVLTDLPGLLGRLVDPRLPLSLTFGAIQGGTAENVIPTEVVIRGTCRTSDPDLRRRLPQLVPSLIEQITMPTGAIARTDWRPVLGPVSNHPSTVDVLRRSLSKMLGAEAVADTFTSLGAEDFSHYLDHAPGALIRLGARGEGPSRDLHSAWFEIDEECLPVGVKVGVASMLGLLSQPIDD